MAPDKKADVFHAVSLRDKDTIKKVRVKKLRCVARLLKPRKEEVIKKKIQQIDRGQWRSSTVGPGDDATHTVGRFSKDEETLLTDTITNYGKRMGLDFEETVKELFSGRKSSKDRGFLKLAEVLPSRSVNSIYQFVRRHFTAVKSGPWSKEDQQKLLEMHKKYGPRWTLMGKELGRLPEAVAEKHRYILAKIAAGTTTIQHPIEDQEVTQGSHGSPKDSSTVELQEKAYRKRIGNRFSAAFSVTLLETVRETMKEDMSLGKVRWKEVAQKFPGNTPSQLRQHYYYVILPKILFTGQGYEKRYGLLIVARQAVRYFYKNRRIIKDLTRVRWQNVPSILPGTAVAPLIRGILGRAAVTYNWGPDMSFRKKIKCLYENLNCKEKYLRDCFDILEMCQRKGHKRLSISHLKQRLKIIEGL